MPIKTCVVCGKKFGTNVYNKKYCSKECASKARSQQQADWKANNPTYFSDYFQAHKND
jgi:predicted nucleic acid-binding Zn ribbon protein